MNFLATLLPFKLFQVKLEDLKYAILIAMFFSKKHLIYFELAKTHHFSSSLIPKHRVFAFKLIFGYQSTLTKTISYSRALVQLP